jgi:hypothetical protein
MSSKKTMSNITTSLPSYESLPPILNVKITPFKSGAAKFTRIEKIEMEHTKEDGSTAVGYYQFSLGNCVAFAPYGVSRWDNDKTSLAGVPYRETKYTLDLQFPMEEEFLINEEKNEKITLSREQLDDNLKCLDFKKRTETRGYVDEKIVTVKRNKVSIPKGTSIFKDKNLTEFLTKTDQDWIGDCVDEDEDENKVKSEEETSGSIYVGFGGKDGILSQIVSRCVEYLMSKKDSIDEIKDLSKKDIMSRVHLSCLTNEGNVARLKGLRVQYFPHTPEVTEEDARERKIKAHPEYKESFCKFFDPSEGDGKTFTKKFLQGNSLLVTVDCLRLDHIHVSLKDIYIILELRACTILDYFDKKSSSSISENCKKASANTELIEKLKQKKSQKGDNDSEETTDEFLQLGEEI